MLELEILSGCRTFWLNSAAEGSSSLYQFVNTRINDNEGHHGECDNVETNITAWYVRTCEDQFEETCRYR